MKKTENDLCNIKICNIKNYSIYRGNEKELDHDKYYYIKAFANFTNERYGPKDSLALKIWARVKKCYVTKKGQFVSNRLQSLNAAKNVSLISLYNNDELNYSILLMNDTTPLAFNNNQQDVLGTSKKDNYPYISDNMPYINNSLVIENMNYVSFLLRGIEIDGKFIPRITNNTIY